MTPELNSLAPLEGRSVRLFVGNTPVVARVLELSGLALKLSLESDIPAVPRVRVELEEAEEILSSLQLQGMVTSRETRSVTITLERLMLASGREAVDAVHVNGLRALDEGHRARHELARAHWEAAGLDECRGIQQARGRLVDYKK